MTQTEFDQVVLGIQEHGVRIAYNAARMRIQNDPDCNRIERELMMLTVIIEALKNYDITSEILTDAEIAYYFELATQIVQYCPS